MVNTKKKGASGQAKNFITRTQAVRKLQISLPDFRRLCIFKGIYPREPRNKKKASKSSTPSTTFYYTKDIQYLLHEPLLAKFREHKTLSKKISKALGRGDNSDAAKLERTHSPKLSLDHVIKERYPTFVDALRDLDDALSMLFLFANLPSTSTVPPKTIALCQRLCLEFQTYLIVTHSLKKSFLSIKGIYYQATIQGQDILWLVPYQFVQKVTGDVDFRIMGTFVEFYTTLLGFVNFRLYNSIGLVYPPKLDTGSDDRGGELRALTLEAKGFGEHAPKVLQIEDAQSSRRIENGHISDAMQIDETFQDESRQTRLDSVIKQIAANDANGEETTEVPDGEAPLAEMEGEGEGIDHFDVQVSTDADDLPQPSLSAEAAGVLFAPFTFYLSRETPRRPLEFLLRAFGCKRIGWDEVLGDGAFTTSENDPSITHQVVDRPPLPPNVLLNGNSESEDNVNEVQQTVQRNRIPGRTYIQPQWIWDCVNSGKLMRPDIYAPGAELPPHLSPFVKPKAGEYDPTIPLNDQEVEDEVSDDEDVEESELAIEDGEKLQEISAAAAEDEENSSAALDEEEGEDSSASTPSDSLLPIPGDGLSESEDEATQHQRELEAEAAGVSVPQESTAAAKASSDASRKKNKNVAARKKREEEEQLERQKMMMSRKKRKMLDKMLYSNQKKEETAEGLRKKRRKIEKGKVNKA
ncbi:MAG: mRNA-binding ribosome synthesis protein [Chaenotheca gracillima]|nr:MAG: mRNA-binding ribosome synthesis protein [Chaenotheca gracillima]